MSQSNTQALSSPSNITKILSWLRDETPQNFLLKILEQEYFLSLSPCSFSNCFVFAGSHHMSVI
jgi:hypothetical protein